MLLENNPYPRDVRVRGEAEALVAAGHDVTVLAPRAPGQPRRETVRGVEVSRFWLPPDRETVASLLLEYAVAHVQLIARAAWRIARGADVVHLHNPPDTLFPAGALARFTGRRMVFDNHDLSPELFAEKFGSVSPLLAPMRLAQRLSMRLANLVVASNESQAEIARSARRGQEDGVVVVRNGPRSADRAAEPRWREGELSDPRLLFLGTLASQDGVLWLPELMRDLRDRHGLSGAHLTVVGDGPARAQVERRLAAEGVEDAVTLTGWVPYEQVPGLLAGADVCVDPAPCGPLNHRSTMMKVAEYLAAGRPVVAFELLESRRTAGDAALFAGCDDGSGFADLVARLARDGDLRRTLGERAVARRDVLVWERSAEALVEAYERL
jgi:glycosyltransferase involved in cell wall biosynthesis